MPPDFIPIAGQVADLLVALGLASESSKADAKCLHEVRPVCEHLQAYIARDPHELTQECHRPAYRSQSVIGM